MAAKKIIAIDDDAVLLRIIENILIKNGFEVSLYKNPAEGLKAIKQQQPHAVLLDRIMPEMDGNDVLHQLQQDDYTRDIPVMMVTGRKELVEIHQSFGLGARDYIIKPFEEDDLILRLNKLMNTI
ncbi:MAG: response regulator [Alphaproteobacteria bacterium]|nr:response regulator [Alphaproteobacteria bacterium]|tara:strand:- start:10050 stop:10424 length:375 start_codon:yes stop_codon:yes gene_type:complete